MCTCTRYQYKVALWSVKNVCRLGSDLLHEGGRWKARLAQSAERKTVNLEVTGSIPVPSDQYWNYEAYPELDIMLSLLGATKTASASTYSTVLYNTAPVGKCIMVRKHLELMLNCA
jgi:hypothetical protein